MTYVVGSIFSVAINSDVEHSFFCERELTFTFAMLSPVRLSYLFVRSFIRAPYILNRLEFSAIFLRRLVPRPSFDIHGKFYGDRSRGTSLSAGLNVRGVAKYSDFGYLECYTSETVQDRREDSINH